MRMSKLERITVTMPEEMVARMNVAVEAGEYATISEVVRDALRDWSERQERRELALARLRESLAEGEAGPFCDGDAFFDDIEDELRRSIGSMPDAA